MTPQHVAGRCSSKCGFEDLASQARRIEIAAYQNTAPFVMVGAVGTNADQPAQCGKNGGTTPDRIEHRDRSSTCQRAANPWSRLAWLSWWQPVVGKPRKNNMWRLSRNPFRLSQHTQAKSKPLVDHARNRVVASGFCIPAALDPEGATC